MRKGGKKTALDELQKCPTVISALANYQWRSVSSWLTPLGGEAETTMSSPMRYHHMCTLHGQPGPPLRTDITPQAIFTALRASCWGTPIPMPTHQCEHSWAWFTPL